jgi:hypothetical protein
MNKWMTLALFEPSAVSGNWFEVIDLNHMTNDSMIATFYIKKKILSNL